jgi:peptide deformylase
MMSIRVIVKDPDPILREISKPVPKITPNIHKLLDNMADTMYDARGVGLAAPQIGILKRVIVIDTGEEDAELIEMINPEITASSGKQLGPEGCLSIPKLNGDVNRFDKITVKGLNRHGEEIIIHAEEFLARVFQHEIDHLNGILFTDIAEVIYEREMPTHAEERTD